MLKIQEMTETITLRNVSILDDNINEAEEVFVVIIRLLGVAESTACFQQQSGGECMGNTGGIIIRIRDNDRKLILDSSLSLSEHDFIDRNTGSDRGRCEGCCLLYTA